MIQVGFVSWFSSCSLLRLITCVPQKLFRLRSVLYLYTLNLLNSGTHSIYNFIADSDCIVLLSVIGEIVYRLSIRLMIVIRTLGLFTNLCVLANKVWPISFCTIKYSELDPQAMIIFFAFFVSIGMFIKELNVVCRKNYHLSQKVRWSNITALSFYLK